MAGLVRYNVSVDDTSPILNYSPYADFASADGQGDGLHNGWQTWYTASGYLSRSDGPSPVGESYHLTSLAGASVSLSFFGTGVALYGTSNCSYDVTFDGTLMNTSLVQGVFFSKSDADLGPHNVTLTSKADGDDQVLSFDNAIVTSVVNSTATTPSYLVVDNQNTTAIAYSGDWTPSKAVENIPSSESSAPFHSTTESGASAFLNFSGRAVALYGSTTTDHGQYSVTLNGASHVFNGSSQWLLGNMLMFYQDGLDENSSHSLNLTNLGGALSLNSIRITLFESASEDSAVSGVTHGTAIIGAIVGPVIAFIVVASVIGLYFWTKRRAKQSPYKIKQRSSIASSIFLPQRFRRKDDGDDDGVTLYVVDLQPSHLDRHGSFATSLTDVPVSHQPHGSNREWNDKILPLGDLPTHMALPSNITNGDGTDATERQSKQSFPVTYTPSEGNTRPVGSALSSTLPRSPTAPPDATSLRTADAALVERISEFVVQRIDPSRTPSDNTRTGQDNHLPP